MAVRFGSGGKMEVEGRARGEGGTGFSELSASLAPLSRLPSHSLAALGTFVFAIAHCYLTNWHDAHIIMARKTLIAVCRLSSIQVFNNFSPKAK